MCDSNTKKIKTLPSCSEVGPSATYQGYTLYVSGSINNFIKENRVQCIRQILGWFELCWVQEGQLFNKSQLCLVFVLNNPDLSSYLCSFLSAQVSQTNIMENSWMEGCPQPQCEDGDRVGGMRQEVNYWGEMELKVADIIKRLTLISRINWLRSH